MWSSTDGPVLLEPETRLGTPLDLCVQHSKQQPPQEVPTPTQRQPCEALDDAAGPGYRASDPDAPLSCPGPRDLNQVQGASAEEGAELLVAAPVSGKERGQADLGRGAGQRARRLTDLQTR